MSQERSDNYETLNAFIDGQLADDERIQMHNELKNDDDLSLTLCELRRNDELLSLTFNNLAHPKKDIFASVTGKNKRQKLFLAASFLFMFSAFMGWQVHTLYPSYDPVFIQELSHLNGIPDKNARIVIHISDMNKQRIENVFSKTESILNNKNPLEIEIIANADGLGLLREGTPYQSQIASLTDNHKNVSFKACGIAMKTAKLKEGREIKLIPEARKIPAALDQILKRLKNGWLYFKA